MTKRITGALFFLIFLSSTGYADLGYHSFHSVNGPLSSASIEHRYISMDSEEVEIVYERNLDYEPVNVTAVFIMTNNGPEDDVDMFFPVYEKLIEPDNVDELKDEELDGYLLANFSVNSQTPESEQIYDYDYKSLHYPRKEDFNFGATNINSEIAWGVKTTYKNPEILCQYSLYFTVHFDAGETKKITCFYETLFHFDNWNSNEYNRNYSPDFFRYYLYSGATWNGPIKEGKIVFKYPINIPVMFTTPEISMDLSKYKTKNFLAGLPSDTITTISPAIINASYDKGEVTWEFHDYEPSDSANICVMVLTKYKAALVKYLKQLGFNNDTMFRGYPGITLKDILAFHTSPDLGSELVNEKPYLKEDEPFQIVEGYGNWWKVRTLKGYEGWIQWREVDYANSQELINATFLGEKWDDDWK